MKIRDIMTKNLHTLKSNNTLHDAAHLMKNKNIGSIVICDESQKLQGIITDRDIVLALACSCDLTSPIEKAMTKKVLTLNPEDTLESLTDLMGYKQIRRVPIVDENSILQGIISLGDISTKHYCEELALEALTEISYDFTKDYTPPQTDLKVDDFEL